MFLADMKAEESKLMDDPVTKAHMEKLKVQLNKDKEENGVRVKKEEDGKGKLEKIVEENLETEIKPEKL